MRKAVLITVGNTADPILKAIEEARAEGGEITVFLLYGRPFPSQGGPVVQTGWVKRIVRSLLRRHPSSGQARSPFDVAGEAKRKAEEIGVAVRLFEASDPEDIDICLKDARDILHEAADADQIVVNFTGGTKALSAAAVHAALTEPVSGELVLDYTGGKVRGEDGRVLREEMRVKRSEKTATGETLQQVLNALRQASYREACLLAERLPGSGRGEFVKRAAEALFLWDEFDYEPSLRILARLDQLALLLSDDVRLSTLVEVLARLREPGGRLCELLKTLRRLQSGQAEIVEEEIRPFSLMVADTLENSLRRLREGRATDSVLRSYRAVEVAVQSQLLLSGIKPWRPDWQNMKPETVQRFLELASLKELPQDLALYNGLKALEVMGKTLSQNALMGLRNLQSSRNESYVEHGYRRLDVKDAEQLSGHAAAICAELLDGSLETARASVRHAW